MTASALACPLLATTYDKFMLRHRAFGKQIRALREAQCLTQQQLARAAGYSVKTIWKAEQGRALKRQTLTDIARALDVEPQVIARLPASPKLRDNTSPVGRDGVP